MDVLRMTGLPTGRGGASERAPRPKWHRAVAITMMGAGLFLFIGAVGEVVSALDNHRRASEAMSLALIGNDLHQFYDGLRVECRDAVSDLTSRGSSPSKLVTDEAIAARRAASDALSASLDRDLRGFGDLEGVLWRIDAIRSATAGIRHAYDDARAEIDASVRASRAESILALKGYVSKTITALSDKIGEALVARNPDRSTEIDVLKFATFADTYAGDVVEKVERSIIDRQPLARPEKLKLLRNESDAGLTWSLVTSSAAALRSEPDLKRAIGQADAAYVDGDFARLREDLVAAFVAEQMPSIGAEEWRLRAAAPLAAIDEVSHVALRVVAADARNDLRTANTKLFRDIAILALSAFMIAAGFRAMMHVDFLVEHDLLTKLRNRSSFAAALREAFDQSRREGRRVTVMMIDVDHFKSINDAHGHAAGDVVLTETAARLRTSLRSCDVVARFGGDEFIVMCPGCHGDEDVALATRLARRLTRPIEFGSMQIEATVSIGLARFPDDATCEEDLLARADQALYAVKASGRGTVRAFDTTLAAEARRRHDLDADLARAIDDGAIQLWFQPQMSLDDDSVIGIEALLRWHHPSHGWIAPPEILTAAARSLLTRSLTRHVIAAACDMVARLDRSRHPEIVVAFNLSPAELRQPGVVEIVVEEARARAIGLDRLEAEITEEHFLAEKVVLEELTALEAIGVRLAIDDFGTGYSSFATLRQLSFDRLKIDQSFIASIDRSRRERDLVASLIGVARAFDIEIIAEGIERPTQVTALKQLGCGAAQGRAFAAAMPADEFETWLAQRQIDEGDRPQGQENTCNRIQGSVRRSDR